MFSGSPHVYSGANLSVGYVDDRDGMRLFDATDGRTYSDDAQTRAAKMHLLGDRYGHIENGGSGSAAAAPVAAQVLKACAAEIKK